LRNRVGSSAANRRRYLKKTTSSESKTETKPATTQKVVPAATTKSAAGIVVAAPGAAERARGQRPVSRDVLGEEIKRDSEGRYDLAQVKDKNVIEQIARGVAAPTEQFIQMPKDIIEGVKAEDQVMKETAFDLGLSPLIEHLATAKDQGLTDKNWYWPTELTVEKGGIADSLPPFLVRNENTQSMGFLEGVGNNLGIVSDIATHKDSGNILADRYATSGERFMEAPAYYVGTAIGEVPYWFIGLGQAKAVGTITTKSLAATVKYTAKTGSLPGPSKIKTIIQTERTQDKLSKTIDKTKAAMVNQKAGATTALLAPIVSKAVKILKKDLDQDLEPKLDTIKKRISDNESTIRVQTKAKESLNAKKIKTSDDINRIKDIESSIIKSKETIEQSREGIKNMIAKSDGAKLDSLVKELKTGKTGSEAFELISKVERTVGDGMDTKLKDIRLVSENLLKIRRENISKKLKNEELKLTNLIKKEKETGKQLPSKKIRIQNKIKSLEDTLYDIDQRGWLKGDATISNLKVLPSRLGSKVENVFSTRAQALGDDLPRDTTSYGGRLLDMWNFYTTPIKHMRGRDVREMTELLQNKFPDLDLVSVDEMKLIKSRVETKYDTLKTRIDEVKQKESDIALQKSLIDNFKLDSDGFLKSSETSTTGFKSRSAKAEDKLKLLQGDLKKLKVDLDADNVLSEFAALKKTKEDFGKFDSKLGWNEESPKTMVKSLNYLKKYLPDDKFEELVPKEIISARRSTVNIKKVDGVMMGTIGRADSPTAVQWDFVLTKKQTPKKGGRLRRTARRFKPSVPITRRMKPENTRGLFYSRKISGAGTDTLRTPKNLPDDLISDLKRFGFVKSMDDGTPDFFKGLQGGDSFDVWEFSKISDSVLASDTNVKIKTGDPKSMKDSERDVLVDRDTILYTRKLLTNQLEYDKELSQTQSRITDIQKEITKTKETGDTVKRQSLEQESEQLYKKIVSLEKAKKDYSETKEKFKQFGIGKIGVARGQLMEIDMDELQKQRTINQTNILRKISTGEKFYIHEREGKLSYWKINNLDAITDNMIWDSTTEPATWNAGVYTGLIDGKPFMSKAYADDPISGETSLVRTRWKPESETYVVHGSDKENISKSYINLDTGHMLYDKDGAPYMTKLTDAEAKVLEKGGIGKLIDSVNKNIKQDIPETTVTTTESGVNIASKSPIKTAKSQAKLETSTVINNILNDASDKVKSIKSSFMGEDYELLSIPRVSTDPESLATYSGSDLGYVRSLHGLTDMQKNIIASSDNLYTQKIDTPGKLDTFNISQHALAIQSDKPVKGQKIYNIFDAQYVGARRPELNEDSWIKYAADQQQIQSFKSNSVDMNDTYEMMVHISKEKGMERGFREKLVRTYKKSIEGQDSVSDKDMKAIVKFDADGIHKPTSEYTRIVKDIKDRNLLRNPKKSDYTKINKVKRKGRKLSLDRQIGIVGLNHNFKEIAQHLPQTGVKNAVNRIKFKVQEQFIKNDAFLTSPDSLMSGWFERTKYGFTKKHLIELEKNQYVKEGFIKGIDEANERGQTIPKGYARLYNALVGKVNSPESMALDRYMKLVKEDNKLMDDGLGSQNITGYYGEGTMLRERLTLSEKTELRQVQERISNVQSRIDNNLKSSKEYDMNRIPKEELIDLKNELDVLYLQKSKLERVYISPDNLSKMKKITDDTFASELEDIAPEQWKIVDAIRELRGQTPSKYSFRRLGLKQPKTGYRIFGDKKEHIASVVDESTLNRKIFNIGKDEWNKASGLDEKIKLIMSKGYNVKPQNNHVWKVTDGQSTFYTKSIDDVRPYTKINEDRWNRLSIDEKVNAINKNKISISMKDMRVEGSYLRSFDRLGVEGKRDITQLPPSSAKETMTKLDAYLKGEVKDVDVTPYKKFLSFQLQGATPISQKPIKKFKNTYDKDEYEFIEVPDYIAYDPDINIGQKVEGFNSDVITALTKRKVLKNLGIDEKAYDNTVTLKSLFKRKETIEKKMSGSSTSKSAASSSDIKNKNELNSVIKEINAFSQAYVTTSPKTIAKEVQTTRTNPADLNTKFYSFGPNILSDEYLSQFQSQTTTPGKLAYPLSVDVSPKPQTTDTAQKDDFVAESVLSPVFGETPAITPEVTQPVTQKTILDTSLNTNLNWLSSQMSNTIQPMTSSLSSSLSGVTVTPQALKSATSLITQQLPIQELTSIQGFTPAQDIGFVKAYKTAIPQVPVLKKIQPIDMMRRRATPDHKLIQPLFPILPPYISEGYFKRSKPKKRKGSKKKTWWRTPGWWYESDYWGGKDNLGSGYVTFKGQESAQIKRYEKKTFGMGVGF